MQGGSLRHSGTSHSGGPGINIPGWWLWIPAPSLAVGPRNDDGKVETVTSGILREMTLRSA